MFAFSIAKPNEGICISRRRMIAPSSPECSVTMATGGEINTELAWPSWSVVFKVSMCWQRQRCEHKCHACTDERVQRWEIDAISVVLGLQTHFVTLLSPLSLNTTQFQSRNEMGHLERIQKRKSECLYLLGRMWSSCSTQIPPRVSKEPKTSSSA